MEKNTKAKFILSLAVSLLFLAATIAGTYLYKSVTVPFHIWYYIMAIAGCTAVFMLGAFRYRLSEKAELVAGIIAYILSIFGAMAVSLVFSGGFWSDFYTFMVNIAFYCVLAGFGLLISGDMRISALFALVPTYLFNLASFIVYCFRGTSLAPTDIYAFGTAMNVVAQYDFHMRYQIVTATIVAAAFIMIAVKFPVRIERSAPVLTRLAGVVTIGLGVAFISSVNLSYYDVSVFDQYDANLRYGSAFSFYVNTTKMGLEKRDSYNPDELDAMLKEYKQPDITAAEERPNIIVVMNESFADLKAIGDFKTNEDYMPYFRSLDKNTVKGQLMVTPFGGNTCNTEYEFLTGMNTALLRPNSTPYVQMIFNSIPYSMTSHLKSLGYRTTAFHPYYSNGWNRTIVYDYMGFDKFISYENMFDYIDRPERMRNYVSDKGDYDTILNYLYSEDNTPEPDFIFNITMQNHGGYTYEKFKSFIKPEDMKGTYPLAEQYLTLIKHSDSALEYFLNELKKFDEPTIVVFFGDHQPKIEEDFFDELYGMRQTELEPEAKTRKYYVPFVIWANYDIEEQEGINTSPCFLSGLVMDKAGLPKSRVQMYLDDLQKEVRQLNSLGYYDAQGVFHSPLQGEELVRYYNLQYAILTNEGLDYDFEYPDD